MAVEEQFQPVSDTEVQRLLDVAKAVGAGSADQFPLSSLERSAWYLVSSVAGMSGRDLPAEPIEHAAVVLLLAVGNAPEFPVARPGTHRLVVIGEQSVYKLAAGSKARQVSDIEARGAIPAPVAPARWRTVAGIEVLEMERVEVVRPEDLTDDELQANPWWVDVDGFTLGRRLSGELVVFDAGQFGEFNRDYLNSVRRARWKRVRQSG